MPPKPADRLAGRRIPDDHGAAPVSRHEPAPIGGAKGRTIDFSRVGEGEPPFAGRRIRNLHGLIFARCGDAPAVGAERNRLGPSRLTADSNRFGVALTLEVIPFPGTAAVRALVE